MILSRFMVLMAALFILGACGERSKFRTYNGPEVTEIRVYKAERQMELWHHDRMLRRFNVELGYPNGHKQQEGDRRTPEGRYYIDRQNPDSRFHLSLGISYPNVQDRARASERGVRPGGDIFIHGRGPRFANVSGDWTDGCIAVTDREMEDIYAMVRVRTPIEIFPSRSERFVKEPYFVQADDAVPAAEAPIQDAAFGAGFGPVERPAQSVAFDAQDPFPATFVPVDAAEQAQAAEDLLPQGY